MDDNWLCKNIKKYLELLKNVLFLVDIDLFGGSRCFCVFLGLRTQKLDKKLKLSAIRLDD